VADTQQTSAGTFRLMYRSRDRVSPEDRRDEFGNIFSQARSDNQKRHITGALLLSAEWFVQVLEGDEAAVRSLYAAIERDPRHTDVELLSAERVPERLFARWSMGEVELDDSYLPLIARVSDLSASRGDRSSAEKDALLDAMRRALDETGQSGDTPAAPTA
jgi:hypothetical protein